MHVYYGSDGGCSKRSEDCNEICKDVWSNRFCKYFISPTEWIELGTGRKIPTIPMTKRSL